MVMATKKQLFRGALNFDHEKAVPADKTCTVDGVSFTIKGIAAVTR